MNWIGEQLATLHSDDFPAAVLSLVTLVLGVAVLWAVLVGVLASSPALRGLAVALTPRLLRGLLFAGVTGALTIPAAQAGERDRLDGLRLPDRPLVASATTPEPDRRDAEPAVVVQLGDSLWTIAQDRLDPGAGSAATARAVKRWHQANRSVIGDDPDLIRPGQRLTAPSKGRP